MVPVPIEPRFACPVQQDVRKNYISIVNDAPAHEPPAGTASRSQPGTVKDLVGRITAALKRRLRGTSGPTMTP